MKNPVSSFRRIAIAEAISYLVLLLVAMPLKYVFDFPHAVKVVGWLHGVLFVVFCASLLHTFVLARWPLPRVVMMFIASMLPFVPFFLDRKLRGYQAEYEPQGT